MIAELKKIHPEEQELLVRAPVIISILAALSNDDVVALNEKQAAARLAHIRTFTAEPELRDYYKEVEKQFNANFGEIMQSLPGQIDAQREYLKEQISRIRTVMPKLKKPTAEKLIQSLKGFLLHVFRSNTNAFAYLLLSGVINEIERTIQNNVRI